MKISNIRKMLQLRTHREQVYSTAQYWDSKTETYTGNAVSMWPNKYLNIYYQQEQFEIIENFLPDPRGKKVLDIGCGTGRLSKYMAEHGAIVVGMDFSIKSIEIARSRTSTENPCFIVSSVFDLDEHEAYNIVLSWGTVTIACKTRDELFDVVSRLYKALQPGGKLLLMEPVHKGFLHRVLNMDITDFCHVLSEAGFDIKRIRNVHFWPMRLVLAYVQWPRWFTAIGYHVGQWIMKFLPNSTLGDYKAIYAIAIK